MNDWKTAREDNLRGERAQTMSAGQIEIISEATGKAIEQREAGVALSSQVRATPVGLAGVAGSWEEWQQVGRALKKMAAGLQWAIGDWLNQGAKRWKDTYAEAALALGFETQTLRDYAYVANQVHLSIRIDKLSFSHHRLVAPLEPRYQKLLLVRAAAGGWSLAKMREEIEGRAIERSTLIDRTLAFGERVEKQAAALTKNQQLDLASEFDRLAGRLRKMAEERR